MDRTRYLVSGHLARGPNWIKIAPVKKVEEKDKPVMRERGASLSWMR